MLESVRAAVDKKGRQAGPLETAGHLISKAMVSKCQSENLPEDFGFGVIFFRKLNEL